MLDLKASIFNEFSFWCTAIISAYYINDYLIRICKVSVYSLSVPGYISKYLITRLSVDSKKFSTATKELFKEKMSINYYQRITAKEVTEELSVHSLNCNRDLYLFLSLYTVFTIYGFFPVLGLNLGPHAY